MVKVIFWLYLLAAITIVFLRGNAAAKGFVFQLLVAAGTTSFLIRAEGWSGSQYLVLLVDVLILISALYLVTTTNNFWPIWFSGFHSITVAADLAQAIFPNQVLGVYINTAGFWSLPATATLVLGVVADWRGVVGRSVPKHPDA